MHNMARHRRRPYYMNKVRRNVRNTAQASHLHAWVYELLYSQSGLPVHACAYCFTKLLAAGYKRDVHARP